LSDPLNEDVMKYATLLLTATLLATSATAFADGGGKLTVKGKTTQLKSAYAYSGPDPFDPSKQSTVIAFSERLIDARQIDASKDLLGALSHAMNDYSPEKEERPASVEVVIARSDPDSPVQQIGFELPGLSSSASVGAGRYKLDLQRNDALRIEGTLRSTKEADKTAEHGGSFDLHFELDVASPTSNRE
jgi:hypothetical protein